MDEAPSGGHHGVSAWELDGYSEADAAEAAKQIAYDCAKSVAHAGHPLKGPELVLRIWECTAGQIAKEVDAGRNVFLPGLGTFGMKKHVAFAPMEEFMQAHGLFYEAPPSRADTLAARLKLLPRVKLSLAPLGRLLQLSVDVASQALQAMLHRMGQEMANTDLAVNFAPLGIFLCRQKHLTFHPPLVTPAANSFSPTVQLRKLQLSLERRRSKFRGPQAPKGKPTRPRPHSRHERARMARSLPAQQEVFPDLLNEFSRTRAAPFIGMEDPGSPSTRIASSFTKSRLTWKPCQAPARSLRWEPLFLAQPFLEARSGEDYRKHFRERVEAGSPLDLELQEAQMTQSKFFETLFRYNYYFDTIPSAYLAPFSPVWTDHIHWRLAATGEGEHLQAMWEEILEDHRQAIRKVIIEHVLTDDKAKTRTGILFVPSPVPLWGTVAFEEEGTGLPAGWERIETRRHQMAQLIPSTASLILLQLWQKYDTLLLVDLPCSGDLMDLQSFCSAQSLQMKTVRHLLEGWLQEAAEVFQDAHGVNANAPLTLLSTQLRSIVDRSIDAFHRFFGRQLEAFLTVGLQARGSDIELTTSLEDIETCLLRVFEDFVLSLSDLSVMVKGTRIKLWNVTLDEGYVQEARASIAECIVHNLERVEEALAPFDQFKYLLVEDVRIKKLSEDNLTQDHVMRELRTLRAVQESVRSSCAEEIRLHMVSIQCSHINETLRSKAEEAIHILMESILRHLLLRNEQLCKSFEMVVNQVVKKPTSEMELVDLEMYIEDFRTTGLNELLKEFDSIREWLSFLFTCENQLMLALLQEKHFQAIYDSAQWVGSIQDRVFDGTNLKREREALESKFKEQRNKFLEDLEGYNQEVDQLAECGNLRQVDEYLERIQLLKTNFARAHVEAEKLNAKEKRFGWEVRSPFEQLKRGEMALEPHAALWTLAYNMEASMRTWLKGPMFHLDATKVDLEVRSLRKEAGRLKELFLSGGGMVYPETRMDIDLGFDDEMPTPAKVAEQLGAQAATMQEAHLKLLYSLCNKALQTRHWEQISGVIGFALEPDSSFTLAKAIEMEVGQYADELQEISSASTEEYAIEMACDAMEEEWKTLSFNSVQQKQTGTAVITEEGLRKIGQTLEEQLEQTSELLSSDFVENWEERLEEWQEWLQELSELLASWSKLQDLWISLEGIFSGREIYKQLPADIQSFRRVDKVWRGLMASLQQQPLVRDICKMPQLLEQLSESAQGLQKIKDRIS